MRGSQPFFDDLDFAFYGANNAVLKRLCTSLQAIECLLYANGTLREGRLARG